MGNCLKSNRINDITIITNKKSKFYEKCLICWENDAKLMFYPCGHFGVCRKCADELQVRHENLRCPYCNIRSQGIEIYFCGERNNKKPNYDKVLNEKNNAIVEKDNIIKNQLDKIKEADQKILNLQKKILQEKISNVILKKKRIFLLNDQYDEI